MTRLLRAPKGLKGPGQRFWGRIMSQYDHTALTELEIMTLTRLCRALDYLQELEDVVDAEGVVVRGKPHPALSKIHDYSVLCMRLRATLGIDQGTDTGYRAFKGAYHQPHVVTKGA